jgi:hypothetical protein
VSSTRVSKRYVGNGPPELEGGFRRHRLQISNTSHSVSAEKLIGHAIPIYTFLARRADLSPGITQNFMPATWRSIQSRRRIESSDCARHALEPGNKNWVQGGVCNVIFETNMLFCH